MSLSTTHQLKVAPSTASSTTAAAPTFSFPVMKLSEIVQDLDQMQIHLTLAQLKEPKEEELRPVFEKLLERLTKKTKEELKQVDFRGLDILSFPELHDESLSSMGTLKELLDLCRHCEIRASVTDFLFPETKPLQRILSGLINYAKFCEDRREFFDRVTVESQQIQVQKEEEETKVEELERQKAQLAQQHEQLKPQMVAIQGEQAQLAQEVEQLVATQATLREEMKVAKAANSELATALTEINEKIKVVEGENKKIRDQIVPEPEKLKQTLKDMTNSMHANRGDLSSSTTKLKSLQTRVGTLSKVEEKLVKRLEFMKSILSEQNALAKLRKEIQEQLSKEHELETANMDLAAQEQLLKDNLAAAQEKLFTLQRNFENKRITAQAALEQVSGEKENLERMVASAKSQAEQNENLMSMKKQQAAQAQQDHQRTMATLRGKFHNLQTAVNDYHKKLAMIMSQAQVM